MMIDLPPLLRHPGAVLTAAIVLGAASFWGASRYLEERAASVERNALAAYDPQPVIVARSDLAAGTRLGREELAIRRVPARFVTKSAVAPAELSRIEGRQLLYAVGAGEPLSMALLAEDSPALFSASIPAGFRALTFPVDEVSSFSGLLAPGDLIDLLYSAEASPGGERATSVQPLLQAVRVRATGRTTHRLPVRGAGDIAAAPDREFVTITLDLSPEDAQRVVLAQRLGELTAVLRNPGDSLPHAAAPLDGRSLFPRAELQSHRLALRPPGRKVEIILGGRGRFIEEPEAP